MTQGYSLETVERTFRDTMQSRLSFFGKAFRFLGDFQQIMPVVITSNQLHILTKRFKQPMLFPLLKTLKLR